ncbi:MAG: leucyl aminopeptidase [Bacteroidetes bacterium]|nr:leucyl aminopeptidase [Bacteroidota bacterium]
MFILKLKSGDKKISYKPLSISVKFLIDEKKLKQSLENFIKVTNVQLSELQKKSFLSKEGNEIRISKHDGKPDELFISKIIIDDKFSSDHFRNHLAGFIQNIGNEEVKYLHISIPKYEHFKKYFESEEYFYRTFMEGIYLGNYSFDKYKKDKKAEKLLEVYFYADDGKKLSSAINKTVNLMEGVGFTKDLQNEPSNVLVPSILAERISSTLKEEGVKVKVFDEKEIKKRKMGGVLAVGSGSNNPPRFIVIEYNGAAKKYKKKLVALVGKGVTFDSGGISIKPSAHMGEMKADMSGAAVVAGTILAAAKAKLPVDILGVIPSVENMPSGKSFKPGDIVITASGKSIEIEDTDAEGRVILSDALDFASKAKPDVIIDLATLTGACVVALGEFVGGLFTKDDKLADELYKTGQQTFDRLWRLPLWDDYNFLIKTDVADVKNLGGRWGGAITAAKFLENFVDKKISWAHLDIAGPAMANDFNNYTKKFMTGYGVRLLFEYLENLNR